MKNRKSNQLIAAGCMVILSAVNIYGSEVVYQGMKASAHGTPMDITNMNPDTYGVSYAWNSDGKYIVEATQEGFQSSVTVQVTFDEEGEQVLGIEVVSQAETEGMGTQITNDSFAEQFAGVTAPVRVRDMEIISPGTREVYGYHAGVERGAEVLSDPMEWNPEDRSVEAQTTRKLYQSGLLKSSIEKRGLVTATADLSVEGKAQRRLYESGLLQSSIDGNEPVEAMADLSPEEKAQRQLYEAGLSQSAVEGSGQAAAVADLTPEGKAQKRLEQSGLSTKSTEVAVEEGNTVEVTEVDGISGATISSKAVGHAVDNAYFFLKENVIQ